MIGVIVDSAEHAIVCEFFELFKTPWEFYRKDGQYDVMLCASDEASDHGAKVVLFFAGKRTHFDDAGSIEKGRKPECRNVFLRNGERIPIYRDAVTFPERSGGLLTDEESHQCAAYLERSGERLLARIGYDLFGEVRTLLTEGQPPANADIPTLDRHIAFLRHLIVSCGLRLAEIPPVPEGFRFIVCLTHDVDHPSIRRHGFDHTAFGFLYRAIIHSLRDVIRGRIPIRALLQNWVAACKFPCVQLGLAKDFWADFAERYLDLEKGLPTTYFVIPFAGQSGRASEGPARGFRGARYGARDIAASIHKLRDAGCEIGLHGIDAWLDSENGREELAEIQRLTGAHETGVRMHWLFYDGQSPTKLEKAGAAYDSTFGYNQTVGYRAGTSQAYKPLSAQKLLELPLHAMDTAMFYPAHLGLSQQQAGSLLRPMLDHVSRSGGCFTVNWHDRSLVPERLWDASYCELVQDLRSRGAWFCTAGQAVSWFRKRRSAEFGADSGESAVMRATVTCSPRDNSPGLRLRHYKAQSADDVGTITSDEFVDIPVIEKKVGGGIVCGAPR